MKTKSIVVMCLSVIWIIVLCIGCFAGKGTADRTETEATTADAPEAVTIWYYWETEGHQKALDKVIHDYNQMQDEVEVVSKYVPFADFKKQLSIGASTDELPDLVILDMADHISYASMGIFADLTEKFDVKEYEEKAVDSCSMDGRLYGIPFGINCLGLYYNKDMLEEAGCEIPSTWQELKEVAEKLTKGDVTGLAFSALQNEEGTFNFMPWLWSAGTEGCEIASEEGIKALSYIKEMTDSGVMSRECINWTQGDVMNQFVSGKVAMMVNGSWQLPTMNNIAADMNWDVTLIPKDREYASCLGGENYAVIKGGNEEGALAFLEYATEKAQVEYLMASFGYISADKTIAKEQYPDDKIMDVFKNEMQYARERKPLEGWVHISDAISLAFHQVMTGALEPEKAAEEAQITIDSIMGQ